LAIIFKAIFIYVFNLNTEILYTRYEELNFPRQTNFTILTIINIISWTISVIATIPQIYLKKGDFELPSTVNFWWGRLHLGTLANWLANWMHYQLRFAKQAFRRRIMSGWVHWDKLMVLWVCGMHLKRSGKLEMAVGGSDGIGSENGSGPAHVRTKEAATTLMSWLSWHKRCRIVAFAGLWLVSQSRFEVVPQGHAGPQSLEPAWVSLSPLRLGNPAVTDLRRPQES